MPRPRRKTLPHQKTSRLKKNHSKLIGAIVILAGVILFSFPFLFKSYSAWSQTIKSPPAKPTQSLLKTDKVSASGPIKIDSKLLSDKDETLPPEKIIIPSVNIDLPIIEAKVVNGLWETSQTTASHGIGSANPGEIGNTVIFGHAREELFGPLRSIKPDASIYILAKEKWFRYQVKDIKFVDPTDVEVIAPTSDQTLTIYTCSGFLDSKRLIIFAKPI